jgi:protein-L-isoaspartate(D-aspartate) O-methyltransferase
MADQEQRAALVMLLRSKGIREKRVLNAFERMPRQHFIATALADAAGRDSPLPLLCGQTMERPSQAAKIIESMQIEENQSVLEIGSGSGWLSGVLSQLAAQVVSYERYAILADQAKKTLQGLDITNVRLIHDDGLQSRKEAKFDRILVSASVQELPAGLTERLAENGRLFIAVGPPGGAQQFTCFHKSSDKFKTEPLFPVYFSPLESGVSHAL